MKSTLIGLFIYNKINYFNSKLVLETNSAFLSNTFTK